MVYYFIIFNDKNTLFVYHLSCVEFGYVLFCCRAHGPKNLDGSKINNYFDYFSPLNIYLISL
jgi:cbb3-type cytochrome oxidase subunit 1